MKAMKTNTFRNKQTKVELQKLELKIQKEELKIQKEIQSLEYKKKLVDQQAIIKLKENEIINKKKHASINIQQQYANAQIETGSLFVFFFIDFML